MGRGKGLNNGCRELCGNTGNACNKMLIQKILSGCCNPLQGRYVVLL